MDGTRFDVWTRRRFGMAASGIAASAVSLMALDAAAKKKGKKKKKCKKARCKSEFETCQQDVEGEHCCLGLNCDRIEGEDSLHCCRGVRSACEPGSSRCCGDLECSVIFETEGPSRCCIPDDGPCSIDEDCCTGECGNTGICAVFSDRALKANFGSIDPADMLSRVRDLRISTWNYTGDDPSIRHIGPMAQDFAAAFGVGVDDRHIHPIDGQGIALAAIQGLALQLEELRAENARLAMRLAEVERHGLRS
jgi:hypothetical protein